MTVVASASASAAADDVDDDYEGNTFVGCGNVFCSSELLPPDIREMLHLIKKYLTVVLFDCFLADN